MRYAIVSLADGGSLPRRVRDRRGVDVYDDYAPHAWFVSFDGTARELTDLVWPDEMPDDQYEISSGIVIPIPKTFNGYASFDLWDWLKTKAR